MTGLWTWFHYYKNSIPESYKDNPPSHYYENSTSGSKNKNTAEIAQAFQVIGSHDEVFAFYAFTDTIGVP
ncbi:hypothetical protein RhiirC2_796880 [Rhizophagus irregularis]|uniref:Uncharacterized protein n=1 Tax=Rhizophagus irregularis TaxID=588596 RepID=A0A2N1M8W9_9GLOM|nr:hypothetical protein RhiirC2_796880 [Rhizophagus irregularis]